MRASELHRLARTLREIALEGTGNVGPDRVNAGQLAVFEDVARNAGASIAEITARTGLAQSLVSRIIHAASYAGALTVTPDERDRRKVRVELSTSTRSAILKRASAPLEAAIITHTPHLTPKQRDALQQHLAAAAELLFRGDSSTP